MCEMSPESIYIGPLLTGEGLQHVIMPSRCCMGHHAQSLLHGRGEAFAPASTYSLSVQSILLVDVTVLVSLSELA